MEISLDGALEMRDLVSSVCSPKSPSEMILLPLDTERERESVCVCVCVRERERERERERGAHLADQERLTSGLTQYAMKRGFFSFPSQSHTIASDKAHWLTVTLFRRFFSSSTTDTVRKELKCVFLCY